VSGRVPALVLLVVLALVLQTALVARLPLPGAPPDLVLALVVAVGLVAGSRAGVGTGFAAGLLVDLSGDAALGRTALALLLAGYLAGLFEGDPGPVVVPAVSGAVAALLVLLVQAGTGALVDDPRVTGAALLRSLASTVPYCAALTPVVVPPVAALLRRADRRP
jgi:rod shape-determining protein MreD